MFDFIRYPAFSALIVITLSVVACSPRHNTTPDTPFAEDNSDNNSLNVVSTTKRSPFVQAAEVMVLESFPAQANVFVTLDLPSSCHVIEGVTETRNNNLFTLEINIGEQKGTGCLKQAQHFEQIIPLDLANLSAGIYSVDVNGQVQEFELAMDNYY